MVTRFRYYLYYCLEIRKMFIVTACQLLSHYALIYIMDYSSILLLSMWIVILTAMKVLSFYSRSNGLLNFHLNGLQVVTLMSVLVLSFALSIRSNVFRRQQLEKFVRTISKFNSVISKNTRKAVEDTKGVNRNHKSKKSRRHYNGQKEKEQTKWSTKHYTENWRLSNTNTT